MKIQLYCKRDSCLWEIIEDLEKKKTNEIQHSGLGKNLMREAEKISKEEFDAKKILVISAVGTREYYQKLGYSLYGPYMSKILN